ncbi:MAG: T9SS type A sorting domain-containing protein [Candidatus Electryonea clarkiae]|nr:T9SS type A sorting domain-containing protein [Candidatus Electryonea clarkiae]MDP8287334.1 T9SS type A sorting domain-containing protein [Candidatus Electryonea clarkiae]
MLNDSDYFFAGYNGDNPECSGMTLTCHNSIRFRLSSLFSSLLLFFFLLSTWNAVAQTEVEGDVYGVWDVEGSPYLVVDTLIIPEDSTLLIEPGVTVVFLNQIEHRFPFYVHGTLEAVGEEGDSIYFTAPDSAFQGFVSPSEYENTLIRLEYCVIDSAVEAVVSYFGNTILRHSKISAVEQFVRSSAPVSDTTQFCAFIAVNDDTLSEDYNKFVYSSSGDFLFQDNTCLNSRIWIGKAGEIGPICNNVILSVRLQGGGRNSHIVGEVYNNQVCGVNVWWADAHIHHNRPIPSLRGSMNAYESNVIIEYNGPYGELEIDGDAMQSTADIRHNQFIHYPKRGELFDWSIIDLTRTHFNLCNNLVISGYELFAVEISGFDPNSRVEGNTIVFKNNGIFANYSTLILENNILVGDSVNSHAIWLVVDVLPDTFPNFKNNLFHNINELVWREQGVAVDSTNIFADPYFRGGQWGDRHYLLDDPEDFQLHANSPCIDAGNPESPLDPDNTRADMGAFYFDQDRDNPPSFSSPTSVFAQSGTEFSYTATVYDDDGPLTFTCENLPEWLEIEDENLTWISDSLTLSGTVPNEIDDFDFRVIAEDGVGQMDTLDVFCEVVQYTMLRGALSGTLSRDNSPYVAIDDIAVSTGDSLVIEPGCEIYFKYFELDLRLNFICNGTLTAEGSVEDTIVFSMLEEESEIEGWIGIILFQETDTTRFSYISLQNSLLGIYAENGADLTIHNSSFVDNTTGIHGNANNRIFVDSCSFNLITRDEFGARSHVFGRNSDIYITNSSFTALDTTFPNSLYTIENSNLTIQDCLFQNISWLRTGDNSTALIQRNRFLGLYYGITFSPGSTGLVTNNLFYGVGFENSHALRIFDTDSVFVRNNVFQNFGSAFFLSNHHSDSVKLSLLNNIFVDNTKCFELWAGAYRDMIAKYNDFFDNDTIGAGFEPDSTNLFVNPLFADTIDYYLWDTSPMIDAGRPDLAFDDQDGTVNDIGLWGGPYGIDYDYPTEVIEASTELPLEFSLGQPYPNPFNPVVIIPFQIPSQSDVELTIYNIMGQVVKEYDFHKLNPGSYRHTWDASGLSSGIYFVKVNAPGKLDAVRKVVLMK